MSYVSCNVSARFPVSVARRRKKRRKRRDPSSKVGMKLGYSQARKNLEVCLLLEFTACTRDSLTIVYASPKAKTKRSKGSKEKEFGIYSIAGWHRYPHVAGSLKWCNAKKYLSTECYFLSLSQVPPPPPLSLSLSLSCLNYIVLV